MSELKNIVQDETNLFKKVILVISIAFVLIILNSYSGNINALLVEKNELVHLSSTRDKNLNNIPIYISKFWGKLSRDEIPNNYKKYNCTATVQMLYAIWLKKLAVELGYRNANEMISYSLKVVKIKEVIDNIIQDTLNNYKPGVAKFPFLQEKECWGKIHQILNSSYDEGQDEYDAIDNFLIKIGLIDESDFKSSTWEVVDLMLSKGYAIYEKRDNQGKKGRDVWQESKTYLPLDDKAINGLMPGDILTGKYYATHYPEKYTTHLTVYLGIRDGEHTFAEQFGDETRITSLEKMYKALRMGFEAIFRPVVIISKEKTEEFLAQPLADYDFGNGQIQLLFFKEEAKNFLFPIQLTLNELMKRERKIS